MEDLKAKIEEVVSKLKNDPKLLDEFKADPAAAVKNFIGIDLPEDSVEHVISAVKAKMAGEEVSGIIGKIEGFFHKK
ncbi:MAG: hypothetical protein PHS82_11530 [Lachnospiraceae bacterium]|nr:hypothetical protein [Lachnospiraceae bacterium]